MDEPIRSCEPGTVLHAWMSEAVERRFGGFQTRPTPDGQALSVSWDALVEGPFAQRVQVTEERAGSLRDLVRPLLSAPIENATAAEEMLHALRSPRMGEQDLRIFVSVPLPGLHSQRWRLVHNRVNSWVTMHSYDAVNTLDGPRAWR